VARFEPFRPLARLGVVAEGRLAGRSPLGGRVGLAAALAFRRLVWPRNRERLSSVQA